VWAKEDRVNPRGGVVATAEREESVRAGKGRSHGVGELKGVEEVFKRWFRGCWGAKKEEARR
jgi:hypothetical protein